MEYVYTAMWFAIGLILLISFVKENKVFILAGGYFLLLGTWWLLDILLDVQMFEGVPGICFKVFTGAVLVFLAVYFIVQYFRGHKQGAQKKPGPGKD